MRGTAGTLVVLTALSGCAVVRDDSMAERIPANTRAPGPAAQTAWKQHNLKAAQANNGPAVPSSNPTTTVTPQSPWPAASAQVAAPPQPGTGMMDRASGTLVSATFVETAREPSNGKAETPIVPPEIKTAPAAPAGAGAAATAAASSKLSPPPPPRTLPAIVQNSAVLPPPEPPMLPTAPEVQPVSHAGAQPLAAPSVRMVNNRRINLNFELKDVGESGVSAIELWYTQDTRTWKKYDGPAQTKAPYVVEVDGEGLYGFTMVARSGVGFSRDIPQPGELPQVWVEVDLTKPVVQVAGVELKSNSKTQTLTVQWNANDKNLTARPITISYAEKPEGPWTPIVANLENTGKFEWTVPASVPKRIHMRVEATDLVGHLSAASTAASVLIDRARPSVSILTVEPEKKEKE